MSLTFTGDESVFGRLGKLGKIISAVRTWQRTTLPLESGTFEQAMAMYDNERKLAGNLINLHNAQRNYLTDVYLEGIRQQAIQTVIEMVRDDTNIPKPDLRRCIEEVISQMTSASQTVEKPSVSIGAIAAGGSNTGNGNLVLSIVRPDGLDSDLCHPENLTIYCVKDALSGFLGEGRNLAVPGSELFWIRGAPGVPNKLHWDWGQSGFGSGCLTDLVSVNAANDFDGANLLVNGDMEDWTGATPDYWAKTDASSQISKDTTTFHDGLASLKIANHATGTPKVWQQFASTSGSRYVMKSRTNYTVNFWVRKDGAPTTGTLTVRAVDGSGNVINDDQGVAQSTTYSIPGWTTSFVAKSFTFRLKKALPSAVRLEFFLSVALDAGNAYIDRIAMTPSVLTYPGGLYAALFSGIANWVYNDSYAVTISNNRGGASNLDSVQTLCQRLFPMGEWGLQLPSVSGGGETIADTVITA